MVEVSESEKLTHLLGKVNDLKEQNKWVLVLLVIVLLAVYFD